MTLLRFEPRSLLLSADPALAWAAAHGLRSWVKLFHQFSTVDGHDHCMQRGQLGTCNAVGAELLQPAVCAWSNVGPVASINAYPVTQGRDKCDWPAQPPWRPAQLPDA